jgi:hypothetical protein
MYLCMCIKTKKELGESRYKNDNNQLEQNYTIIIYIYLNKNEP